MHFSIPLSLFTSLATLAYGAPSADPGFLGKTWDVIVVGSGPAGIITATRMAEAGKKTLLLEQGGPSYYFTGGRQRPQWLSGTQLSRVDVPGLFTSIFDPSTNPGDLLCGGRINGAAFMGCTVGGSSAVNAGLFFTPPASDFDQYFPKGWKSDDVASAIQKLDKRQPSQSTDDYLQGSYKATKNWLVGGKGGYREVDFKEAPNDVTKVVGHPVYDYVKGMRGGPARSYLQRAQDLPNFSFSQGVHVQRVIRNGKTATGVVVSVQSGSSKTVKLAKNGRVILSGGALQSPALLMRSAIGDPAVLKRLANAGQLGGVAPKSWINNTAVGAGLFDNPNTYIELETSSVKSYVYTYDSPARNAAKAYLSTPRKGPYTFAGQTAAFWDAVKHDDDDGVTMCQGTIGTSGFEAFQDPDTITLNVYGTSGLRSHGSVTLDDNLLPTATGGIYYSDEGGRDARDIATFIHRIFDALPSGMRPLNMQADWTVARIAEYITTPSAYARGVVNHWSSSCRFGKCVDTDTKVMGTDNVHVVDASIVPPLTVNPQKGIMIAAERAVERILAL